MSHDHPFFDHVKALINVTVEASEDGKIDWPESARIGSHIARAIDHALTAGVNTDGLDCDAISEFAISLYDEFLADYDFAGGRFLDRMIDNQVRRLIAASIESACAYFSTESQQ